MLKSLSFWSLHIYCVSVLLILVCNNVLGGGGCRIILYAIALADEDQELVTDTRRLLTAKEGFANLAHYLASVSR